MMSGDMLSQDEIDALLKGTDDSDIDDLNNDAFVENTDDYFSSIEQDALGEIGNISFGSSATALSTLLNQKVEITTPSVRIIHLDKLEDEFPKPYVAVQVKYTEGFTGSNLLVIKQSDAAIIADLMLGGDGTNPSDMLGEIQLSAVQEAMNQMMGSSATSMSTIFNKRVDISPPSIDLMDLKRGEGRGNIPDEDKLVKVSFNLKVGDLIDSTIMQLYPVHFAKELVNNLLNPSSTEEVAASTTAEKPETKQPESQAGTTQTEGMASQPFMEQQMPHEPATQSQPYQGNFNPPPFGQQAYYQGPPPNYAMGGPQYYGSPYQGGVQPSVQPAVFSDFEPVQLQEEEQKNLNILLDIPLQVTVELGRTKRSVKEILEISSGSIIELDKLAGEPVDILVNNRLIAKGEVVVIDENFGVRVTDIISQSDRIKKLR